MPRQLLKRFAIISESVETILRDATKDATTEQVFAFFGEIDKSEQNNIYYYIDEVKVLTNNIDSLKMKNEDGEVKTKRDNFRFDLSQIPSNDQLDKLNISLVGFAHSHNVHHLLEWSQTDLDYFTKSKKRASFLGKIQILLKNGVDPKEQLLCIAIVGDDSMTGLKPVETLFQSDDSDGDEIQEIPLTPPIE